MATIPTNSFMKMLVTHPVLLLSSRRDRHNTLMPLIWYTPVSVDPPLIGISIKPSCMSYHYIRESGDFLLGIPGSSMVKTVHFCGIHSGRDVDKILHLNLITSRALAVSPLLIENCMATIECRVRHIQSIGDHPFITGEVLHISAEYYYYNDDGWTPDASLIYYLGGSRYRIDDEIVDMSSLCPGYIPLDSIG